MLNYCDSWIADQAEVELGKRIAEKETVEYWRERALKAESDCNLLREEIGNLKDEKYIILHTRED